MITNIQRIRESMNFLSETTSNREVR